MVQGLDPRLPQSSVGNLDSRTLHSEFLLNLFKAPQEAESGMIRPVKGAA